MKEIKVATIAHPIKKEFTWKKAKLSHFPGDDFMRSQWQQQTSNTIYLLYRWVMAIFFLVTVIVTMIFLWVEGRYFIYLTHWGLMLCMITNVYGAILVSLWHFQPNYTDKINLRENSFTISECNNDTPNIPLSLKIYWILHMTTLNLAIIISVVYWIFLYPLQAEQQDKDDKPHESLNILEHACNSILMIIDLMIVAFPIRILHIIFPIILGIIYGLFSIIFYLAGGTDPKGNHFIYPILNWDKPGLAIGTFCGTLVLFIICGFITFALYKIRILIYRKYHNSEIKTFNISD